MCDHAICNLSLLHPSLLVYHCLSLILFVSELILGNLLTYSHLYYYLEIVCGSFVWGFILYFSQQSTTPSHHHCILCIAPTWNTVHSFSYLVLYPLWSYAPMLSPCIMFPSVCFMFTFPVTPWTSLILLWDPIQFILVFKPLVFTYVPPSLNIVNYCCLTSPCLFSSLNHPLWVPKRL